MKYAAVGCILAMCVMACFPPLPKLAHPPCPQTCGPSGTSNCCANSVVPGNAEGATLAGQLFYRTYDTAMDGKFPDQTAPANVSDFRLDTYEVTVARFRQFVNAGMGTQEAAPAPGAGAHARIPNSGWNPGWNAELEPSTEDLVTALNCDSEYETWKNTAAATESQPINCLTWYEAMAFCIWDGGYLPTEAEWSYAASGGSEQRPYPWASDGSTTADCSYANYTMATVTTCAGGVLGGTNRVGSESSKGDGRWGQSDLAGNLNEWNLDCFNSELPVPCNDCTNLGDSVNRCNRVYRGGSFDYHSQYMRAPFRNAGPPSGRPYDVGVRCARTP